MVVTTAQKTAHEKDKRRKYFKLFVKIFFFQKTSSLTLAKSVSCQTHKLQNDVYFNVG